MKYFWFILLLVFLFSCSNDNKEQSDIIIAEKIEYPEFLSNLIDTIPLLYRNFVIDSVFFDDSTSQNNMDIKIVKELAKNLKKEEHTEINEYYLNDYIKIETAKLKGNYDKYVQKLDIGMMQDASCNFIGKIEYGDSLAIILWSLKYSSFEACPYFKGNHVLASLVGYGKHIQTFQIAGHTINTDPPMDAENYMTIRFHENGELVRRAVFNVNEEDISIEKGDKIEKFHITKQGFKKNQAL
jgi:hypothetical protein